MKFNKILILYFCLVGYISAFSQDCTATFIILSEETGDRIPMAHVAISELQFEMVEADDVGMAHFENLPEGKINVLVTNKGFKSVFKQFNITKVESDNSFLIEMKQNIKKTESSNPILRNTIETSRIENNGNLSVNQSGGVVNQTINQYQKQKFTDEEKLDAEQEIKLGFDKYNLKFNSCLALVANRYNHQKSIELLEDLLDYLLDKGYKVAYDYSANMDVTGFEKKAQVWAAPGGCLQLIVTSF